MAEGTCVPVDYDVDYDIDLKDILEYDSCKYAIWLQTYDTSDCETEHDQEESLDVKSGKSNCVILVLLLVLVPVVPVVLLVLLVLLYQVSSVQTPRTERQEFPTSVRTCKADNTFQSTA